MFSAIKNLFAGASRNKRLAEEQPVDQGEGPHPPDEGASIVAARDAAKTTSPRLGEDSKQDKAARVRADLEAKGFL
jgi:hypothetical protein